MYMLYFTVPASDVEKVKEALFAAGAGKIGNYSHCAWQVLGEGQFKPLPGSDPAVGKTNKIETVAEYKVETVCSDEHIKAVIEALKQSHPYEVPAYQVFRMESF